MNTINTSNEESSEIIDITPDISLMPKLGFAGYTAPQAIAELVDNSIDASMENTKLIVNINISKDEIVVADNAKGMDKNEISKSLVLAFSRKKAQLGEFGLGLKTACLSIGNCFEVITSKINELYEYRTYFDKDAWQKSEKWNITLNTKNAKPTDHFTIIKINSLRVFYPNLHNLVRDDLKRRYSPFIKSGMIEIKVNGKSCQLDQIEIIEDTKKEFKITLKNGNEIRGWYALMKESSQKGLYGFHTYRRGRMITTYDKIGFDPHPTLARIIGEIHMDHVPVMNTKRGFETDRREYREVAEAMREEIKELLKLARKKASQETVTKDLQNEVDVWKNKISETLKSEEFNSYAQKVKNIETVRDETGTETATLETEKRNPKDEKDVKETKETGERERNKNVTEPKQQHVIRIKGKNIKFNHNFAQLGANQPWKTYSVDDKKGIEIFTNTDFPAYMVTKDKAFYAVVHIAEALSEILIQVAQEDATNIEELKELILRKSSELKLQL